MILGCCAAPEFTLPRSSPTQSELNSFVCLDADIGATRSVPTPSWDTGLCENDDFTLTAYSGYKQVAYVVWDTVRRGHPAPQPDYQAAQRTRVTIGVTALPGANNTLTDLILTRGGEVVRPVDRYVSGGRFTWDYPAWAPTSSITLEMVGEARTISCNISPAVLRQFC